MVYKALYNDLSVAPDIYHKPHVNPTITTHL